MNEFIFLNLCFIFIGKHSGFRLVRIGKPENIHHDVQKYTYREIVKVNQAEGKCNSKVFTFKASMFFNLKGIETAKFCPQAK